MLSSRTPSAIMPSSRTPSAKLKRSDTIMHLRTKYAELYGKPPGGPYQNDKAWLEGKVSGCSQVTSPPADDPPSETLPTAVYEIDKFLETCPIQFQADKLEERELRILNYTISKKKNRKAGEAKKLEQRLRDTNKALSQARLPYNRAKSGEDKLGEAMLKAIASFAKDDDFETAVVKSAEMLVSYRRASVAASAAQAVFEVTKEELDQMQREFTERQRRADELAASVAQRVQQADLVVPKPRGRPRMRRTSTLSLGCDEFDDVFATQEEAASALSSLVQQGEATAAASLSFDDDVVTGGGGVNTVAMSGNAGVGQVEDLGDAFDGEY